MLARPKRHRLSENLRTFLREHRRPVSMRTEFLANTRISIACEKQRLCYFKLKADRVLANDRTGFWRGTEGQGRKPRREHFYFLLTSSLEILTSFADSAIFPAIWAIAENHFFLRNNESR